MATRTTFHLDRDLAERLGKFVPTRALNRFINQAVAEKLAALEHDRLEAELREGYEASEREQADVGSGIGMGWL